MRIKFLGAAGTVTGSSYSVDGKVLVDLGLFQGTKEVEDLNFEPLDVEVDGLVGVIVTHAHLDHCGRLPLLVKQGYQGPIYTTQASKELIELVLMDAAKISKEDENGVPLYEEADVERVMALIKTVNYDEVISLGEEYEFRLRNAGHILGSSLVVLVRKSDGSCVVFSGDLGAEGRGLEQPIDDVGEAKYVVMESTYGDRLHGEEDPSQILIQEIEEIEKTEGTLLIPAFSLERTQELLHLFDHLKKSGKIKAQLPVYLDSPMAIKATRIFKRYKELYGEELHNHAIVDDPFDFPGLVMVENVADSREIVRSGGAKVIVAGSGMMVGGRIRQHALDLLPVSTTRLLFVGYQAVGTPGRALVEESLVNKNGNSLVMNIYGRSMEIKAKVKMISSLSAHADQKGLLGWLGKIRGVEKVVLTHGEEESRKILGQMIKDKYDLPVLIPQVGDEISL